MAMAEWKKVLPISVEWKQAREKEITSKELGKIIASKLRILYPENTTDHEVCEIRGIAQLFDKNVYSDKSFNSIMVELYNWADANRLWVQVY